MDVRFYSAEYRNEWEAFLQSSGTPFFFFHRDFMEYHQDRFTDASTMVWNDGKLVALIPASRKGAVLTSHGGLTFGAFVMDDTRSSSFFKVFEAVQDFWLGQGISEFIYKKAPGFFPTAEVENDIFEIWRQGGQVIKKDLTTYLDLSAYEYSKGRKSTVKKAAKMGLQVSQGSSELPRFHQLLSEVLWSRHQAKPVHTVEELELLSKRFPENIKVALASLGDQVMAGVLFFDFGEVTHTQYLCASEEGKKAGALDFLLDHFITEAKSGKKKFSFGISTEDGGRVLNEGLILQKESFGGRNVCVETYSLILKRSDKKNVVD